MKGKRRKVASGSKKVEDKINNQKPCHFDEQSGEAERMA
jgi:hypothetical protein